VLGREKVGEVETRECRSSTSTLATYFRLDYLGLERKIELDCGPTRTAMSALGQKQTFAVQKGMSALPLKADISTMHFARVLSRHDSANVGVEGWQQSGGRPCQSAMLV
jgi:hypothetical protein